MTEETAAYIKTQRAVIVGENAYWVEPQGRWVFGLPLHRAPGYETFQPAAPWTVAIWEELEAHRSALAEVEKALRAFSAYGEGGLGLRWEDRDKLTKLADRLASVCVVDVREVEKERDDAMAEVARLRGVLRGLVETVQQATA